MLRKLWMIPQVVGLWAILFDVYAMMQDEWLYAAGFGALALLSLYVSLKMATEGGDGR